MTSNEFRVDQMGNDLEVAFESNDGSDAQLQGAIIGDQVNFSQSEERDLQALKVESAYRNQRNRAR